MDKTIVSFHGLPLDRTVAPSESGCTMINQIKFVTIPVRDQKRALDFYTEKLGFTIITDQPFNGKHAGSNCAFRRRRHELLYLRRKGRRAASARFRGFHISARTLKKRTANCPREECFLMRLRRKSRGGHLRLSRIVRGIRSC